MTVTAKVTRHRGDKKEAYSYTFEGGGKKVLFTGDMGDNFLEYLTLTGDTHYDLVVCEMAHVKLCDVEEMLKKTNTDRMYIHHYHIPRLEGHEEIFKEFPFPVIIAKDGDEVVL